MKDNQIDKLANVYKTWQAHRERKYITDVERSLVSHNFQHYIELGGILTDSISYNHLRKSFPKGWKFATTVAVVN